MDRSGTTGHLLRRRGDYFRRLARFLHHAAECKSGGAMAASRVDRDVGCSAQNGTAFRGTLFGSLDAGKISLHRSSHAPKSLQGDLEDVD